MKTVGLFIGRMNPPHNGHLAIIEKSLSENEITLVLLGSPMEKDDQNPLDFEKRKALLESYFEASPKLKIMEIADEESDLTWVIHVYKRLCDVAYSFRKLTIYGGDFKNDSAYKAIKQYESYLFRYEVGYQECSRANSQVEYKGQKIDISASNLRKAIREKDTELSALITQKKILDGVAHI